MPNGHQPAAVDFFVEVNPNPVVMTDESLTPLYLNSAARLHLADLEKLGARHPVLQGLSSFSEQLKKQSEGLITFVRQVEMRGKTFEEQIFALPQKKNIYFYLVDITERLQAEESLKAAKKELEGKVAELETLNRVMMDREERILELKDEIKAWKAGAKKSSI